MIQDEMVGWHHRLNGHESEHAPGACDGQGGLVCCGPWGHKDSDKTERLKNNKVYKRGYPVWTSEGGDRGRGWDGKSEQGQLSSLWRSRREATIEENPRGV